MLLQPLKQALQPHGIRLLRLPSAAVRAGVLLNSLDEPVLDLNDVEGLWEGTPPQPAAPASARLLLDETSHVVDAGVAFGLGLPALASVRAMVRGHSQTKISFRGVHVRRFEHHGRPLLDISWLERFNQHLDLLQLELVLPEMRQRLRWLPSPRKINIVEATVHVAEMVFTVVDGGEVSAAAEVEKALPVDIEAGFDIHWEDRGQLVWTTKDIPLGFLPVRYAWAPYWKKFMLAQV